MLENSDLKVPLNLQNRSLAVQGRIRVIRDEDENCLEVQGPEALEKESGWRFNGHGLFKLCGPHSHPRSGRITRADENYFGERRRCNLNVVKS